LKQKWINAISRKGADGGLWVPSLSSKVCSQHFTATDYDPLAKVRRLNPTAVPSIFNDYPVHKQPKVKVPRKSPKPRNSVICKQFPKKKQYLSTERNVVHHPEISHDTDSNICQTAHPNSSAEPTHRTVATETNKKWLEDLLEEKKQSRILKRRLARLCSRKQYLESENKRVEEFNSSI